MILFDLASRIIGLMALIAMAFGTIERTRQNWVVREIANGAAFGVADMVCMMFPATLADGTSINGRSLFLAFAAAFGGWISWATVAVLTTALHVALHDVMPSQLVPPMVFAGALALTWKYTAGRRFGLSVASLTGLGVWVSLVSALLLVLSKSGDPAVFVKLYPIVLLVCVIASLLLGLFFQRELRHIANEEHWRSEAYVDSLTRLPNKRAFQADYREACAGTQSFCLVVLDVDHFTAINDTYGHEIGDHVLRELGKSLAGNIPEKAKAYRLGGEEFAVIAWGFGQERAREMAEALRVRVSGNPNSASTGLPKVTASAGMAFSGSDGAEPMSAADAALYHAKALGRNRVATWSDVLADRTRDSRPGEAA